MDRRSLLLFAFLGLALAAPAAAQDFECTLPLSNTPIDSDDAGVFCFSDLPFVATPFAELSSPFTMGGVSGELRSAVYSQIAPEFTGGSLFAYAYQVILTDVPSGGVAHVAVPIEGLVVLGGRSSFRIEDHSAGSACGLDDPSFGESPSPLSRVFEDYDSSTCDGPGVSIGVPPVEACIDGAVFRARFNDLTRAAIVSEVFGFVSIRFPDLLSGTLLGRDRTGTRVELIAPERDPQTFVGLIRGFKISGSGVTGMDELRDRLRRDHAAESIHPRVFDAGGRLGDPPFTLLRFVAAQAPQPADRVILIGHSLGADRAYSLTSDSRLEDLGIEVNGLISIDPIDPAFAAPNQSGELKAPPDGVPFIVYVQRNAGSDFGLRGYSIGDVVGGTCDPEVPSVLTNETCVISGTSHTEIDCDERVQDAIIEIVRGG